MEISRIHWPSGMGHDAISKCSQTFDAQLDGVSRLEPAADGFRC
jgi:hypothetical protein